MPKTHLERIWAGGAAFVAVIVMLIAYMFFISPQRDETSQVDGRVATTRLENDSLSQRIAAMTAENKNLATYERALTNARLALPAVSGLPDFLRTLQAIGNATLTSITAVTVGTPAPVAPPTVAPTAAATGTSAPPSTAPSPAAKTASPAAPAIYSLAITAQVSGTSAQVEEFLRQLQSVQPRAVLITQIDVSDAAVLAGSGFIGTGSGPAASANTGVTIGLTMSAFVAPSSATANAIPSGTATR